VSEVLRHQIQLTTGYPCVRTIPGWTFHRTDDLEMVRPVLVVGELGDCQIEAQSFDVFRKAFGSLIGLGIDIVLEKMW